MMVVSTQPIRTCKIRVLKPITGGGTAPMPKCTTDTIGFGRVGRRKIEANFNGGDISSDGGLILLRQVDRKIGLSKAISEAIYDPRNPNLIQHTMKDMIGQRILAIACGYEVYTACAPGRVAVYMKRK
jgi:hypothetical protein